MPLEHVNRRGERYYVLQGTTKTGNPKFYASRKPDGVRVERLPPDYEIYEHPAQGLVSVRKIRSSRVLPAEREAMQRWTRELAGVRRFQVAVEGDSLVIYTAGIDPEQSVRVLSRLFGTFPEGAAAAEDWIADHATYQPMLRFTLVDERKRRYVAERWCFLGSIDDWFPLSGGQTLDKLAKKYLPHLGQESFFELM
jgi:hypothetical protein